jgi:hypothetical protein
MPKTIFRFYEELNDYLPEAKRKIDFEVIAAGKKSLGDIIGDLGVPLTEVDLVLCNGRSVNFQYALQEGDRVSVYPVFERLNISPVTRIPGRPLRRTRFIADTDLEDIAKAMRDLGLDIYFDPSLSKQDILEISRREGRIILTGDRALLGAKGITRAILVDPKYPSDQVRKIMNDLGMGNRNG